MDPKRMIADAIVKVHVENYKKTHARYGKILVSRTQNLPKIEFDFPCCLLSTQAGTVTNLTQETLSYIPSKILPNVVQFPAISVVNNEEVIENYPGTTEEFFALSPTSLTYLSTHDCSAKNRTGYNTTKSVAIWGRNGKFSLDVDKYKKLVKSIKPTFFEILSDNDTQEEKTSIKRIRKSLSTSLEFFKQHLKFFNSDESLLQNTIPLICLQGGHSMKHREEYVKIILELIKENEFDKYFGYVIDALPTSIKKSSDICRSITSLLPADKVRLVHGSMTPIDILTLIDCGCDIFDTTYPCMLSEEGKAITFPLPGMQENKVDEMDLTLEEHIQSFIPIVAKCECYTCKRHTRAYINHLFNTREMLGPLLLTLHNLHHYLTFFKELQLSFKNETYDDFKKLYF